MSRKQGFTLIELLVVIAIIAILAAILFPVFVRAKAAGLQAKDLGHFKQIGSAISMYLGDYGRYPLTAGWSTGFLLPLRPYFRNTKVGDATMQKWDDNTNINGQNQVYWDWRFTSISCPAKAMYAANMWGLCGDQALPKPYGSPFGLGKFNIGRPEYPVYWRPCSDSETGSDTILFICIYNYPWGRCCRFNPDQNGWPRGTYWPDPNVYPSHGDGFNIVFADGHVKWTKRTQVRLGMWTAKRGD